MNAEFIADFGVVLYFLAWFNGVLVVGCIVSDYILPRIPFIQRFLDSLPDYDDEEDF